MHRHDGSRLVGDRAVRFLAELPKTGSGKIAKRLLREP
jgi:acyl-coenzyme A synthetase/AMP-(fatty) acid ligase